METLPAFLKRRAARSLRYLWKQIETLTPEEAFYGRRENWPDQRWGIGQNGSIAGIVYHVAAWKELTLPVFAPGRTSLLRTDFDPATAPAPDDWPGILAWLQRSGDAWNAALAALPDAVFAEPRSLEGETTTVAGFVVEMYEHDIQHAAQIEYLLQRRLAETSGGLRAESPVRIAETADDRPL